MEYVIKILKHQEQEYTLHIHKLKTFLIEIQNYMFMVKLHQYPIK